MFFAANFMYRKFVRKVIILVIHNLITDYLILRDEPDAWHIIISDEPMNTRFMVIYTLEMVISMMIHETLKLKSTKTKGFL
jgi:hypothetical protein